MKAAISRGISRLATGHSPTWRGATKTRRRRRWHNRSRAGIKGHLSRARECFQEGRPVEGCDDEPIHAHSTADRIDHLVV